MIVSPPYAPPPPPLSKWRQIRAMSPLYHNQYKKLGLEKCWKMKIYKNNLNFSYIDKLFKSTFQPQNNLKTGTDKTCIMDLWNFQRASFQLLQRALAFGLGFFWDFAQINCFLNAALVNFRSFLCTVETLIKFSSNIFNFEENTTNCFLKQFHNLKRKNY